MGGNPKIFFFIKIRTKTVSLVLLFFGMFILGPAPPVDEGFHVFLSLIVMGVSTFSGIYAFFVYFSFRDKMDRK